MGVLADAVIAAGGARHGVIPERPVRAARCDTPGMTELRMVEPACTSARP